jgi:hypothetical protein
MTLFSIKKTPAVKEISLRKDYQFMYEGFLITTQHNLYLLLEEHDGLIDALSFQFLVYTFGYPNDEVAGAHPMSKHGLGYYGVFEVKNSPWIEELKIANRVHPQHTDDRYNDYRHIIICYKDNTLDVICSGMKEIVLSKDELINLVNREIEYIKKS